MYNKLFFSLFFFFASEPLKIIVYLTYLFQLTIYTDLHRFPSAQHTPIHLRSLRKNNRKFRLISLLTRAQTHTRNVCVNLERFEAGHNLQRCIYPVTPSVLHPLCSHEMRVCDIWADSINITAVLYQFCSASSMRPDIAHRLACCDNLSSRTGRGVYVIGTKGIRFPSLRNERTNERFVFKN